MVPTPGFVFPESSGETPMVRFAVFVISAKFAVTVASPVNVTVVSGESGFAMLPDPLTVQFLKIYPCAGFAIIGVAVPTFTVCGPMVGSVVPEASGETAIESVAVIGFSTKTATIWALPYR